MPARGPPAAAPTSARRRIAPWQSPRNPPRRSTRGPAGGRRGRRRGPFVTPLSCRPPLPRPATLGLSTQLFFDLRLSGRTRRARSTCQPQGKGRLPWICPSDPKPCPADQPAYRPGSRNCSCPCRAACPILSAVRTSSLPCRSHRLARRPRSCSSCGPRPAASRNSPSPEKTPSPPEPSQLSCMRRSLRHRCRCRARTPHSGAHSAAALRSPAGPPCCARRWPSCSWKSSASVLLLSCLSSGCRRCQVFLRNPHPPTKYRTSTQRAAAGSHSSTSPPTVHLQSKLDLSHRGRSGTGCIRSGSRPDLLF
mmetsp:Transcript_62326/g.158485  ORF Transcript_62326/g.158485 Transcript_62326/m.158485 type:complete len:308 (-) Transcript_62326:324-1247(-)